MLLLQQSFHYLKLRIYVQHSTKYFSTCELSNIYKVDKQYSDEEVLRLRYLNEIKYEIRLPNNLLALSLINIFNNPTNCLNLHKTILKCRGKYMNCHIGCYNVYNTDHGRQLARYDLLLHLLSKGILEGEVVPTIDKKLVLKKINY